MGVVILFVVSLVIIFFGVRLLCIETKGKDIRAIEKEYQTITIKKMIMY